MTVGQDSASEMDWTDGGNHGPFGGKKGTGRGSVEWVRQELCFGDGQGPVTRAPSLSR